MDGLLVGGGIGVLAFGAGYGLRLILSRKSLSSAEAKTQETRRVCTRRVFPGKGIMMMYSGSGRGQGARVRLFRDFFQARKIPG